MNQILLFILFSYSLSIIVFPFKTREDNFAKFESPINETKIPIKKYLYHIINDFHFISDIDVGIPKQKVEVLFDFDDNYLTLLLRHITTAQPYNYNLSSTYKEIKVKDPDLHLLVYNSHTIKEIFHMKNKFYDNLKDFLASNDEVSHEFTIIFSKSIQNPKPAGNNIIENSNTVNLGILVNTKYQGEHGIYKPFLDEIKENGYMENDLHFYYFFKKYKKSLYAKSDNNLVYDGLLVFGKYPHDLLPNKFDIKQLYWTNTFLEHSEFVTEENIIWGFRFSQVYVEFPKNKTEELIYLRGVFDLEVENIFCPDMYFEIINKFFEPLGNICFEETNTRNFNNDGNIYRMIYCDYEEFGKNYLKSFPKLVFKSDDFNEVFEFTYEDLFKPIYNNKYYLFLIFTKRLRQGADFILQPPSYPWVLGKIFLKKYQFVFDSLNKKVGYYKVPLNDTDDSDETDNISDEMADNEKKEKENEKEIEKENEKEIEEELEKEKEEEKEEKKEKGEKEEKEKGEDKEKEKEKEKEKGKGKEKEKEKGKEKEKEEGNIIIKTDETDFEKNEEKNKNKPSEDIPKNEANNEKKSLDVFIIIIIIVVSIIVILIIGICFEYFRQKNKKKKKKKANELIDETGNEHEEEESKDNNIN